MIALDDLTIRLTDNDEQRTRKLIDLLTHLRTLSASLTALSAADVAFVAAGDIEAADVQAAIEELDAEKAAAGHTHDDRYYTEGETDALLAGKSDTGHSHVIADVTGLQGELDGKEPSITSGTAADYWRGDKTFQTLDRAAVGLGSVDNTADADKPVSTAQQTALDLKAPLASPAFTGSLSAEGGAFSNGLSVTTAGATALFTLVGSGDRGVISGVKSDLTSYAPLSINALTEIRLGVAASGFSVSTTAIVTAAAINLATGKVLQVNGTQVVGARGAAVANAVAAAGAPTQAEFNAFVTQFNALLARVRTHGLIAP